MADVGDRCAEISNTAACDGVAPREYPLAITRRDPVEVRLQVAGEKAPEPGRYRRAVRPRRDSVQERRDRHGRLRAPPCDEMWRREGGVEHARNPERHRTDLCLRQIREHDHRETGL